MSLSELVRWPWNRNNFIEKKDTEPFFALQEEINHLFDRFFDGFGMAPPSFGKLRQSANSFVQKWM